MALTAGEKAPAFSLKDKEGRIHSLSDIRTSFTALYFYPKDDTPGCTIEAKEFSKDLEAFKQTGITIMGISGGDEKTKKAFCDKHQLTITLLSDPDFAVSTQYKVYGDKVAMGNKTKGIYRTTFILDKDKKILKVFENVKPEGHAQEVLRFIRGESH